MSQQNLSLKRISDEASSMHSAGYFIDTLGCLLHELAADAPSSVETALNGYTVGGVAAGLQLIGGQLMNRAEKLQDLLRAQASEAGTV
ncbi:hypothetical protein PCAU_1964 [Pseudomonas chlororaphis subsp. aurantiaca]|uniref:hypothetical protein n=1 Tax=Pseudomonas chlororaphis TaxID=587753 RepID=UPI000866186F|nr:hypothetical protein [Pseudomonas chlororaphis]BAV74173.1 hypothetical protein PCAU_1964 [Pseudomonas chlororaphis subsp. aurantiaca]